MRIDVDISNNKYLIASELLIKYDAKMFVIFCEFSTNEILLDNYLKAEYNMTLREACAQIITSGTIQRDVEKKNLRFICNDKYYDKLATLITYGNGKLQGSKILRQAFGDIEE